MHFTEKLNPWWLLRLGMAAMYLYSGIDLMRHPSNWYGYMPQGLADFIGRIMPMDVYVRMQGAGELLIAFLLLAWFLGKWGARIGSLLASLELLLITFIVGVDLITFRDLGLLGGALALVAASWQEKQQEKRGDASPTNTTSYW